MTARVTGRGPLLLLVLLIAGLAVAVAWSADAVREHEREAHASRNARTLQVAAEVYAVRHDGRYAADPVDLVPFLPAGRPLVNPCSGRPVIFDGAPGDLGWECTPDRRTYRITLRMPSPDGPRLVLVLSGAADRP